MAVPLDSIFKLDVSKQGKFIRVQVAKVNFKCLHNWHFKQIFLFVIVLLIVSISLHDIHHVLNKLVTICREELSWIKIDTVWDCILPLSSWLIKHRLHIVLLLHDEVLLLQIFNPWVDYFIEFCLISNTFISQIILYLWLVCEGI